MSRIGNMPIAVPGGVDVKVEGQTLTVKGGKGELSHTLPDVVRVEVKDGQVTVRRTSEEKFARSMHGTARSLIANMIEGVAKGYQRDLEIQGVGYRAQLQGNKLVLNVGYSHPIEFVAPEGITLTVPDNTNITIAGPSKQLVGQVSAQLRSYAPAEPYKGKGIRYKGEHVRRKAGKTVA